MRASGSAPVSQPSVVTLSWQVGSSDEAVSVSRRLIALFLCFRPEGGIREGHAHGRFRIRARIKLLGRGHIARSGSVLSLYPGFDLVQSAGPEQGSYRIGLTIVELIMAGL